MIRTSVLLAVAMTFAGAGCSGDSPTSVTLVPAIPLRDRAAAEPRIAARIDASSYTVTGSGSLTFEIRVTNGLPESIISGACVVERMDVKPVSSGQWVDGTVTDVPCPGIAIAFPAGVSRALYGSVDLGVLRAVAGRAGRRVLLRARHVVDGASSSFVVQSAEQEFVVP